MEILVFILENFVEGRNKDSDKWNIGKEVRNEDLKKEFIEDNDTLIKEKDKEFLKEVK